MVYPATPRLGRSPVFRRVWFTNRFTDRARKLRGKETYRAVKAKLSTLAEGDD
jgi:hypothetical protein